MELSPIEGLAFLADAPVPVCLEEGARWTLLRVLHRRWPLHTIFVLRRMTTVSLPAAKTIVGLANVENTGALGDAVERGDHSAAVEILRGLALPRESDGDVCERLATALLEAFAGR